MSDNEAPRELSIPDFVEAVVRRIAALPGCDKVAFDPAQRAIRYEYLGEPRFARPQAAYTEYRKDIRRLEAVLDAQIGAIRATLPPPPAPAAPEASLAAHALRAAETLRKVVREQFQFPLDYDLDGVRWLDAYVEGLHQRKVAVADNQVEAVGAFLGECFVRNMGGAWDRHEGMEVVRFEDGQGVFPFNKVRKHWANGKAGGDSVLGLYRTFAALRPRAPSEMQKRLEDVFRQRRDYTVHVLAASGDHREWPPVEQIEDGWLRLGKVGWSGSGRLSIPLAQAGAYYVVGERGQLVYSEGIDAAQEQQLPEDIRRAIAGRAAAAPVKASAHRIATQPPDREQEQVLAALRQRYAAIQKNPTARTFESMRAPDPHWMKPGDGLSEIGREQLRLLAEGRIHWAALVQANKLLFKPGPTDSPGLLVYSTDHHFDARPQELRAIASRIFELKNSTPIEPELKEVARLVTDEMDRSMGGQVPAALTDKEVRIAAFMVFRKHIPGGVLSATQFPILVHPATQAVMIVPFETWPGELVRSWRPPTEGRTLEDIRRLPEGLRVAHSPNPVAAVRGSEAEYPYRWEFSTAVEALHGELTIVEFGAFGLVNGRWRFSNAGGEPFSGQQFAEWYSCPGGALRPGMRAADPKNWSRSKLLRSSRCIWYYIGKDADGKLFRGEAELEERGTLVPPDSEGLPAKPTGGLVSRMLPRAAPNPCCASTASIASSSSRATTRTRSIVTCACIRTGAHSTPPR